MKTCEKCNDGLYQDNSNFCLYCGEKLVHHKIKDDIFDVQSGFYRDGQHCVDRNGKIFMVVKAKELHKVK